MSAYSLKAVFDTLYLARARGRRFSQLTEVELPADSLARTRRSGTP